MLDIIQNLPYINLFTEVLPFIFLLIFYKRIKTRDKRIFFIYASLTTLLVLFVIIFRYIYTDKESYFLIARIHTFIEFSLIAYIFSLFIKSNNLKKIAFFSAISFFILCATDYFFSKTPSIAFIPLLTECLFFILLIIYFFFEKLKQDANEPLFNTFIFWFAVAFLINFSGNFLLFVYSETSIKDTDFKTNYIIIYSTVTILKNILLCIAVTMKENPNGKKNNGNELLKDMNPAIFNPTKIESY